MKKTSRKDMDILNRLFREQEDVLGSTQTTITALECLRRSLRLLKCRVEDIPRQIIEVSGAINHTEPRVIPLIHLMERFESEIRPCYGKDVAEVRQAADRILADNIACIENHRRKLVQYGLSCVADDDVIFLHSVSSTVLRILLEAKSSGRRFRVIVLKQDIRKTRQVVIPLIRAGVAIRTVPEYSLGHFVEEATRFFLGAISITRDNRVVAAAGTGSIVGMCHLHHVPVYLFIDSLKFSHQNAADQNIHHKTFSQRHDNGWRIEMSTQSHDFFDAALVDHLITETGERGGGCGGTD